VLLMVGIGFAIKTSGHGGPATASATPLVNAKDSLASTAKSQEDSAELDLKAKVRRDQYIQQMDGSITRDIFLADLDLFPRKNVEPVKVVPTSTTAASAPAPMPEDQERKVIQAEAPALVATPAGMVAPEATQPLELAVPSRRTAEVARPPCRAAVRPALEVIVMAQPTA